MIIEGNPYQTKHYIHANAIRGALLSVLLAWQVPVIFSKSKEDTVTILLMAAQQSTDSLAMISRPKNYRRTREHNRRLFFLQGIPFVGAQIADRLLKKFGSLKAVINASETELQQVEGIGKKKAKNICEFIGDQLPVRGR